jgi:hypothetical protein
VDAVSPERQLSLHTRSDPSSVRCTWHELLYI